MGLIYTVQRDWETALNYLKQSLAIHEKNKDKKGQSLVYNNIGLMYHANEDLSSAELFLKKSLKLRKDEGDEAPLAAIYSNLAAVEHDKGKKGDKKAFNNALKYLKKAQSHQTNNYFEEANVLKNMGEIHVSRQKWIEAIHAFLDASVLLQSNGLKDSAKDKSILEQLTRIGESIGQPLLKAIVNKRIEEKGKIPAK
jgi:tetratricopeptide (TPR) repeat protein